MRKLGFFSIFWLLLLCLNAWAAPKVAIFGGGVAGLSAAHELAERGFEVDVYESRDMFGGKARSIGQPQTGVQGRADLPGEHGFRFIPGFYQHLPDTLKRIPFAGNSTVYQNLVRVPNVHLAGIKHPGLVLPAHLPRSTTDFRQLLEPFFNRKEFGISTGELVYFSAKLAQIATMSEERSFDVLEKVSWWDFVGAAKRSKGYQKYLATGLMRNLVAARPQDISARTGGTILLQLLYNAAGYGADLDRILGGPTNEMWIDPWVAYLRKLGVRFHSQEKLARFDVQNGKITSAQLEHEGGATQVTADYYLAAVPVEVLQKALTPKLLQAAPHLAGIQNLHTDWMNGIQFFLRQDVPIVRAHTIYFDSPWALTSVSQAQFWKVDLSRYGDGNVRGILSIDISNWDTPGILFNKPAKECTREEIKAEVLAQMARELPPETAKDLQTNVVGWMLDPAIEIAQGKPTTNGEPLLINTKNSWQYRPDAKTEISNFFLAADFVRTNSDLACMESANEAARRATNAILEAAGSDAAPARIWKLRQPLPTKIAQFLDRWSYLKGYRQNKNSIVLSCARLLGRVFR